MELHWFWLKIGWQWPQVRVFTRFSWFLFHSRLLQLRNAHTKFRRAGCNGCGVTLILVENRVTMATGTSFHSFFLILFLFFPTIATECTYKISKGWVKRLWSYIGFGWKWIDNGNFFKILLCFLFILRTISKVFKLPFFCYKNVQYRIVQISRSTFNEQAMLRNHVTVWKCQR